MEESRDVSPREAARAYGQAGIAVLPLHYITREGRCSCGQDCDSPGKHPWSRHGVKDATTDDAEICASWDKDPNLNIGITPTERFGRTWIALDIDRGVRTRNGRRIRLDGEAELERLGPIDRRVEQISGSGARHVILRMPAEHRTPKKPSPAIDVIGPGKYIIVAPSNHKSGGVYEWVGGEIPDIWNAPFAPRWLLDGEGVSSPSRGAEGGGDLRNLAKKTDLTEEEFARAVMFVPNKGQDVDYDFYMNMLFAIHFETDGGGAGLELAHQWAAQSDKYQSEYTDRKWDSIRDEKGANKGGKFVLQEARKYDWEPLPTIDWQIAIQRINKDHAYVNFGADARVLKEIYTNGRITDVEYLKLPTFIDNFLPETYNLPARAAQNRPNNVATKDIGTLWRHSKKRRQYDRVAFEPNPRRARVSDYNLYRGLTTEPTKLPRAYDGCSMLVDHIYDVVAGGNEEHGRWIIAWLAQIVQEPWKKLGTSLVLIGSEGAGKSIVGEAMKALLGIHHVTADNPHHILGNFNSALASAIFVQMEESFWAGDKRAEGALKHLVTGQSIRLEPKGVDAREIRNYARVMITTNQPWAVPAGLDARRFAVFRVLDTVAQDRAHFKRLVAQLDDGGYAAWLQYLLETDLSGIDVGVAPRTAALLDQKLASLTPIQSFVVELVDPDGDMAERVWKNGFDQPAELEIGEFIGGIAEPFYKSQKYRWSNNSLFASELNKLLPPHVYKPHGGKRCYRFGTLAECHEIINKALGQKLF